MSLTLYQVVCSNGHTFQAANAPAAAYGELVMYGKQLALGPALLSAIGDPVFDEVSALVDAQPELRSQSERERSDRFQEIFGIACDPAPDGSQFQIGFPACPSCGTRKHRTWSPVGSYSGPVLPITHVAWKALSDAQKVARLRAALRLP
jgi:hypothetical protein